MRLTAAAGVLTNTVRGCRQQARPHARAGLPIVVKDLTSVKSVRFTEVRWRAKTRLGCHNLHILGTGEPGQPEYHAWRVFLVQHIEILQSL